MDINPIAHIRTDFPEKFGVPRQSGLAENLLGTIVFEPAYRDPQALRGLEGFSHIWLIWGFSANRNEPGKWQPTVRPPRLGGNERMGVFATRSPFRPNPIGLSCVEVHSIVQDAQEGPVIVVKGADLMDGTPIYDIKPYIRYADSRPDSRCGYVETLKERTLEVVFPEELQAVVKDKAKLLSLNDTLKLDPRPSYHEDPERIYGLTFSGYNVRFRVSEGTLYVVEIEVA